MSDESSTDNILDPNEHPDRTMQDDPSSDVDPIDAESGDSTDDSTDSEILTGESSGLDSVIGQDDEAHDTELTPIQKLEQELAEANDRWVRSEAEFDNFRKRSRRDLDEQRKYASAGLLTDMLGVMDNLHRAIESAESNVDGSGLLDGVKMLVELFEHTLSQHGCQPIQTVGEVFDPNRHEAVIMEPTDQFPANSIIRELRTGYQLHDRVLRPPQVVVAAPPQP